MSVIPTLQDIRLFCRDCESISDGQFLVNVPLQVAAEWMKLMRCPECGSKKISWVIDEAKLRAKLEKTA